MTRFVDVRLQSVGGGLASSIGIHEGTMLANYQSLPLAQLLSDIRGRHVLIGTHGFNVNRANAIAALSSWEALLTLESPSVFIGLLWPGDSTWAHGLDYPDEPRIADDAGKMLAAFINANFSEAASISFASHSLGVRVLLETVANMTLPVRRALIMAGAIDNNCLNTEFSDAASKIGEISLLASSRDTVLSSIFPLGNLFAGIISAGHPWFHTALGRQGPANPRPGNVRAPFQIPDNWGYGHGNYLEVDSPPPAPIATPIDVAPNGTPPPGGGTKGWQEAWSAAFASTRFK